MEWRIANPSGLAKGRATPIFMFSEAEPDLTDSEGPQAIRVGRHTIRVPGRRWQRVALGVLLVAGGVLGFLPVVGFWMIPLGLAVLAIDSPRARRLERRLKVKATRIYRKALNGARLPRADNQKGR